MKKLKWSLKKFKLPEVENDPDDEDGEIELALPKIVNTPLGPVELTDISPKVFAYHLVDTNFNIGPYLTKIADVLGVEILRPLSRYKFALIIGKLFKVEKVKKDIEKVLGVVEQESKPIASLYAREVLAYAKEQEEKFKEKQLMAWAFYIFPNGKMAAAECKDNLDMAAFIKNLKLLREARRYSNGMMVESSECVAIS